VLHSFTLNDGGQPYVGSLIFDNSGALYGTTNVGGLGGVANRGVVFKLTPPGTTFDNWTEAVLHSFGDTGCADGSQPLAGVTFDASGALYGTTVGGGSLGCDINVGTVFKLTPPATPGGGAWTESVLHRFTDSEGVNPPAGVIFDNFGALYGTTQAGANGYGTLFMLTPPSTTGGVWTLSVLHSFTQNEGYPSYGNLVFDESGALYGATIFGGTFGYGTIFKLTPPSETGGIWTLTVLHSFTGNDGAIPYDGLILDKSGALYGTTIEGGGYGFGTVFKLAVTFDGTPGRANCHGTSVSALNKQFGGLNAAASALGFSSVSALQNAVVAFCEQ